MKNLKLGDSIMTKHYRLTHIDMSIRFHLALLMLSDSRPWGMVTDMAQTYQVSRKFLYQIANKAENALLDALSAQSPGPKPISEYLTVDNEHIQRAIITLATIIPGSVRGIKTCLQEILDTHCSIGFISQSLKIAGDNADKLNQSEIPRQSVLGEADEIFQGHHPCLTVVDGRSFAVLQLSPQESRDADTWGISFLQLQERGVQFADIACDGARGIRAGIQQSELAIPLRPDLFHLTRESGKLKHRLESSAYKAMEQSLHTQRADEESKAHNRGLPRRVGCPLKVRISLADAKAKEQQAIECYDLFVWLQNEIRQSLDPYDNKNNLISVSQTKETIDTAISLLSELGESSKNSQVKDYAKDLKKHKEALIGPLEWLEQRLSSYRQELSPEMESIIIWSYKHQQELGLSYAGEGFPEDMRPIVEAYWKAISLFHRSSSLAESFHSFLRPYFDKHRGIPRWLPSLLVYYWNHHEFQRGKRKGKSPLGEPLTWSETLDNLMSKAA
jgi:hypothetical protein